MRHLNIYGVSLVAMDSKCPLAGFLSRALPMLPGLAATPFRSRHMLVWWRGACGRCLHRHWDNRGRAPPDNVAPLDDAVCGRCVCGVNLLAAHIAMLWSRARVGYVCHVSIDWTPSVTVTLATGSWRLRSLWLFHRQQFWSHEGCCFAKHGSSLPGAGTVAYFSCVCVGFHSCLLSHVIVYSVFSPSARPLSVLLLCAFQSAA